MAVTTQIMTDEQRKSVAQRDQDTISPPPPHAPVPWPDTACAKGQAMIATLRHRLIGVPARLVRPAGTLILRLQPGYELLEEVLTHIRALPATS